MSRENVETVRAAFKAWNVPDMNAWRELHDPNVILRNPEGWPEPGPFVGLEAVERNFEEARGLWNTDTLEPVSDFIDVADRVLVRTIWRGVRDGVDSHLDSRSSLPCAKARSSRSSSPGTIRRHLKPWRASANGLALTRNRDT